MSNANEVKVSTNQNNIDEQISTIRIESSHLDKLMNLSGELVTLRAQFSRLVTLFEGSISTLQGEKGEITSKVHEFGELTAMLSKISSDIQSGIMQVRMMPIESVFSGLRQPILDAASKFKKEIDLVVEGEDTELDKKIIDVLSDPLLHILNFSINNGIESTDVRLSQEKPEKGMIKLKSFHKGNSVCVVVEDDGKGIDVDEIVSSAIEKKLVTKDQVDALEEKEKLSLLFIAGFAGSDDADDLSVVRQVLASVNGSVEVESELGKGTKFILKIPLTLAIIQALLVMIGEQAYAIPIESIAEIIKIQKQDIYSVDGTDTVKLREHVLSLVDLRNVIDIQAKDSTEDSKKVIVVNDGDNMIGVVVDSLIGEDEIVIKALSEHFSKVEGVSGASVLGDGNVAIILDPAAIIKAA